MDKELYYKLWKQEAEQSMKMWDEVLKRQDDQYNNLMKSIKDIMPDVSDEQAKALATSIITTIQAPERATNTFDHCEKR